MSKYTLAILYFTLFCMPKVSAQIFEDVVDFLEEEPDFYEEGNWTISTYLGLASHLKLNEWSEDLNDFSAESSIPAVGLIIEKSIFGNLGVGVNLGFQQWKVPVLNYKYQYFSGSLRAAYHFAILKKLDPYVGGAVAYRRLVLRSSDRSNFNGKITPHLFVGTRYYLTDSLGAFAEFGNDALSSVKLGISLYLP